MRKMSEEKRLGSRDMAGAKSERSYERSKLSKLGRLRDRTKRKVSVVNNIDGSTNVHF
jgi:hypothetical protein